jgi:hypothetical protein
MAISANSCRKFSTGLKASPNRGQKLSTESKEVLLHPKVSGIYCYEQIPEEER